MQGLDSVSSFKPPTCFTTVHTHSHDQRFCFLDFISFHPELVCWYDLAHLALCPCYPPLCTRRVGKARWGKHEKEERSGWNFAPAVHKSCPKDPNLWNLPENSSSYIACFSFSPKKVMINVCIKCDCVWLTHAGLHILHFLPWMQ